MANVKRSALGKGLGALIDDNSINTGVNEVDIMRVEPSGDQPRKNFDQEKLQDLADSIKQHGLCCCCCCFLSCLFTLKF